MVSNHHNILPLGFGLGWGGIGGGVGKGNRVTSDVKLNRVTSDGIAQAYSLALAPTFFQRSPCQSSCKWAKMAEWTLEDKTSAQIGHNFPVVKYGAAVRKPDQLSQIFTQLSDQLPTTNSQEASSSSSTCMDTKVWMLSTFAWRFVQTAEAELSTILGPNNLDNGGFHATSEDATSAPLGMSCVVSFRKLRDSSPVLSRVALWAEMKVWIPIFADLLAN